MTPVSLLSVTAYDSEILTPALTQALEPLGGMGAFVKPGDRVLLKPNLLTANRPGNECITRPELVAAVARQVLASGGKPFLGDSPAFGTALGVVKANGYLPLVEELGIPVLEFRGQRYPTGNERFNHLRLSKETMEADVVINLPKVKSHVQLTVTLGVKNLFGCVPGKMKAWWHMEAGKDAARFGEMLVQTAQTINPELTIVDGIIGHAGAGPMNGFPSPLGVLGASPNVFALDEALATILQAPAEQTPTLAAQRRLGLSPQDVVFPLAQSLELQVPDWQFPPQMMPIDFGLPRVIRSTFKHLYIRHLKERLGAFSHSA